MTYSEPNNSHKLWASRSFDPNGVVWEDTQQIPVQHGDIPDLCVMNGIVYIVYRDGTQLMSTFCEKAELSDHPVIQNPTQDTLQAHASESYYVAINPTQLKGQPVGSAPLYYAVQERNDIVTISYIILYANQGGQTVRVIRFGLDFDCILYTIGMHPGDLERFTIKLQRNQGTYTLVEAGFEAHGKLEVFSPDKVKWEDSHAIVHVALNGHACRNRDPAAGPISEFSVPLIFSVAGWVGSGNWWRPSKDGSAFKQLGLDSSGQPVSDQVWSAFRGRLGDAMPTSLTSATHFDGSRLSTDQWHFVRDIFGLGSLLDVIPAELKISDGPTGPGMRKWVTNKL